MHVLVAVLIKPPATGICNSKHMIDNKKQGVQIDRKKNKEFRKTEMHFKRHALEIESLSYNQ